VVDVAVKVAVRVVDGAGENDLDGEREPLVLRDGVRVCVDERLRDPDTVGERLHDAELVDVPLALPLRLPLSLTLALALALREGLWLPVLEAVADLEGVCGGDVGRTVREGVAV
jgi:hypothetical protein